jgi:hypothetical protein
MRAKKKLGVGTQWPVYPVLSELCDHPHGIALKDAFDRYLGEESSIESLQRQIEKALPTLPEIEQKQLLDIYCKNLRFKHTGFAKRVVDHRYYTSGIRYPYAENPVREHIPPELWLEFKINHEENTVESKQKVFGQRITYVQVLVSPDFWHSAEYDRVALGKLQFRLNKTQAEIVRLLHRAHKQGIHEGLFAKQLLADVGKRSGDLGTTLRIKSIGVC